MNETTLDDMQFEWEVLQRLSAARLYALADTKHAMEQADRSWWARTYKAGIRASLDGATRTPPDGLTKDQRDVGLAGYDR